MDSYVEREAIVVLRVRADMQGKGPSEAFRRLEGKLPTLRGRKFYGAFRLLETGEEYYACVERLPGEDAHALGVEEATIPGGLYVRRKLTDWQALVDAGKLPEIGKEMVQAYPLDKSRPELEYYRSMHELHLLMPVLSREARAQAPPLGVPGR